MNTYPKYKDSGEQWLGQIPEHWEMKRLAACFAKRSENWKRGETLELLSLLKDVGIVPYSEKGNIGNTAKTDFSQYKVARKGDLVINSMNVIIGSLGITPMDGYISPAYYAFAPREGVNTRYYNYILSLRRAQQNIRRFSKGIMEIRLKISANDFLSIQYPVPPKEEQEAMVAYLDEQTAQIDNAIAREQKMIDLLEERKQIIIQHAVTKGLNPNAKMKNSDIEWIGEIPEGWKVMRFKTIAKVQANLVHPNEYLSYPQIAPDNIEKGTGRLLNYSSVFESQVISDNHLFRKGQIIYSKIRPVLNKLIIAPFDGLCSADMYPISTTQNVEFLKYQMLSCHFVNQVAAVVGTRVKMPKINKEELGVLLMLVPPIDEQLAIVSYLNSKLESINKAIEAKNSVISLLQERKQIIINEVVTGKIKVL